MTQETQEKIQAEAARQMGQMMFDLIAANVERQEMMARIAELEAAQKDAS